MSEKELAARIEGRKAVVGIVGMGYVGLPLARTFCAAGFRCVGYDIDPGKIARLKAGKSYIKHIPSSTIAQMVRSKRFRATGKPADLRACDAILICVPTPLNKTRDPDMTYIVATCEMLTSVLRPGQLVVLESTTYPGTTREVVKPILERTGLKAERDFFLAFSPEREDPGRKDYTTETTPKVVGGLGPRSRRLATALYAGAIAKVVPVSSCEVAESAKILENVYRCVNIAMINELKVLFDRMGINVWEVIAAASTKPFGFQPFYPGPGLGGHCIPIDPFYLTHKAKEYGFDTRFIRLAGEINTRQPHYVVEKAEEVLRRFRKSIGRSRVLILGIAYKKDIDDVRESPALKIYSLLRRKGAKVDYYDPLIPETGPHRRFPRKLSSISYSREKIASYDLLLLVTDHSCFPYGEILENARLILDTRNAFPSRSAKVFQA